MIQFCAELNPLRNELSDLIVKNMKALNAGAPTMVCKPLMKGILNTWEGMRLNQEGMVVRVAVVVEFLKRHKYPRGMRAEILEPEELIEAIFLQSL